jgi:soluble lytic murein transglycosylase-like protein
MRTVFLLGFAMTASAASAQTAAVMDLTLNHQSLPGVEVRQAGGFTEYRLDVWTKPVPVAVPPAPGAMLEKPSAILPVAGTALATSSVAVPGDGCQSGSVPSYIPGLRRDVVLRRLGWWNLVSSTECRYGLPAGLLDAVILQESRYRSTIVSPKGAIGLTQLMPGTAGDLGVANAYDPRSNIDGGARYLRAQLDRFKSVHLGVAAYNAGPGAVRSAGGIPRNSETPNYVRRVLDYWSASSQEPLKEARRTAQILGFTN